MTQARKRLVSLTDTPYYHCVSRCVRRAFLCGVDAATGQSFEHRRQWIVDRLQHLNTVFAMDICAYAVMSNHYHVVVRMNPDEAGQWTPKEVARRWLMLFSGPPVVRRWYENHSIGKAEQLLVHQFIQLWRKRLVSLSWLMRCLNEPIARRANAEDSCTGRFWEGRFKSQALLDERALLACMAYVDLNPIRASLAETPELSDYTSVQARIRGFENKQPEDLEGLIPFSTTAKRSLNYSLEDYLTLVDWSGRMIRQDKPGSIPANLPPILDRLNIDAGTFIHYLRKPIRHSPLALGTVSDIRMMAARLGKRFIKGISFSQKLFRIPA